MSARRRSLLVAAACAVVLAVPTVAHAYPSPPPGVQCGQTLTVDTVLRRDLTCTGDGLVLAPGVTLDLGGRTLRGSGAGVGVLVDTEGTHVIRNGTLTGWGTAVTTTWDPALDDNAGPLTVDRVRFRDNATGVNATGEEGTGLYGKPTTIMRSDFVGHTQVAIDATWYGNVVVDRSTFTDNDRVLYHYSGTATLTRSRFVRNDEGVISASGQVDIEDCVFQAGGVAAWTLEMGQLKVRGSRFVGMAGTALYGADATVTAASSTFVGNERAVVVGELGGSVTGNVMRENGEAITGWGSGSLLIQDNVLRKNGEGIVLDTEYGAASLGGNDVRDSTGWGIHVPGATDLGGNRARGNGNEPQCVGVVCQTRAS